VGCSGQDAIAGVGLRYKVVFWDQKDSVDFLPNDTPYGLLPKDVIGPVVSIAAALVSIAFAWKNVLIAQRNANRSIYVDGHKFLIDLCKQLIPEPVLWCIYDDELLRRSEIYKPDDPAQQAKLRAFAHLHLNMFEIIINEVPRPKYGKPNASNVWYQYFEDTINRSQIIRGILEEEASNRIWNTALLQEYKHWKESQGANR